MKTFQSVTYDLPASGVARITLNRPARHNALNAQATDELLEAENLAMADPGVVVLIYRGAGRSFCSGRDLTDYAKEQHLQLEWMRLGGWCRPWMLPKPTIAAVQGHAVGGGALLATMCDITVATHDASISYPEIYLGMEEELAPHPWILLVGAKRAKELLMSGRAIDGATAYSIGLVNQLSSAPRLTRDVTDLAERLVTADTNRPGSLSEQKATINAAAMRASHIPPNTPFLERARLSK
jgi:enoyl-CoA hydratase/carnithine racemase